MIKIIVLLVFLAGCSGAIDEPETAIDPKHYQECMKATPPAAFDNIGGTHLVINACERASKIRSAE